MLFVHVADTFFYIILQYTVVIINGKYKVGAIVHIGYDSNQLPKFWEIVKMYILNKDFRNTKFIVSEKVSTHFNEHFQSYDVTSAEHAQNQIAYHKVVKINSS